MFILGYIIQSRLINYIVRAPLFMTLILTYGLNIVIVNLAVLLWTGNIRSTPAVPYSGQSLALFNANIPVIRLLAFCIAILVTIGLYLLMKKTRFGRGINAARMHLDAASLVGVKISRIYSLTFALGSLLAGVSGSLLALVGPITPAIGNVYSAKAFAICILGGSGSMLGPLAGGLLMGLFETAGVSIFGAGYQEVISFFVLLLVLVFRPHGIFGKEYY